MSVNAINRALVSTPINRTARMVASQKHCVEIETDIGRDEICTLLGRMGRKQQLLKHVLSINNTSQYRNMVRRHKAGYTSNFRPSRAIAECVRNGEAMHILQAQIAEVSRDIKEANRQLSAAENAWKTEHPGWIWDGQKVVAPNGAVFVRSQQ
jgi:hypothetical protein